MGTALKKFFGNLDEIVAATCMSLIVLATALGVFMRYVFSQPFAWTEELTMALLVWFTFTGSSAAFKQDGHVSIDFVVARLPRSLQKAAVLFWHVVMIAVVAFVFIYLGYELAMQAGEKYTTVLRVPYTLIDLSVVVCGVYALVRLVLSLFKTLQSGTER